MELPKIIAGVDMPKAREMFKTFVEEEKPLVWNEGKPHSVVRTISPQLTETSLNVSGAEAKQVHEALVSEGWIEPEKFVPTRRGVALAQHVDRPRISRAEAGKILERVLDWADGINEDPDARVKLRAIRLFGSLERGEAEVGDIDLFVEFTTFDLGDDMQPEDMVRESELAGDLKDISEYISPSDELSRQMMLDVPTLRIFPRP